MAIISKRLPRRLTRAGRRGPPNDFHRPPCNSLAPRRSQRFLGSQIRPCRYDARLDDATGRLNTSGTTTRAIATAADPVGRLDDDNGNDLLSRSVRAHDAGVPTRYGLPGCHGKLSRAGEVTAILAAVTVTSYRLSSSFMPGTISPVSHISRFYEPPHQVGYGRPVSGLGRSDRRITSYNTSDGAT
jgi:hypothetical protein